MNIKYKLIQLRVNLRKKSKYIMEHIIKVHIDRWSKISKNEICIFCSSENDLTKEHVLPKWTFENNPNDFFITNINLQSQKYIKTTIPCCANCNNNYLSYLEKYITELFYDNLRKTIYNFTNDNFENIVRWLEIIEYKFQVLEVRRKFNKHKSNNFIKYISVYPISVFSWNGSPNKVISQIRNSIKNITIKSKEKKLNSLIIFKSNNKTFFFSHNLNEYIFLDLPKFNIALFYFYDKEFDKNIDAYNYSMEIIANIYKK